MDKFILGEGIPDSVEYIIHTQHPCFICIVGAVDDDNIKDDVIAVNDVAFHSFKMFSPNASHDEIQQTLLTAYDAIHLQTANDLKYLEQIDIDYLKHLDAPDNCPTPHN